MLYRRLLVLIVALGILTAVSKPAQAHRDVICAVAELGSILVGTASMIVDAGFTINILARSSQVPGYPSATTSNWQIGLMVPQIFITGAGVLFDSKECDHLTGAIVAESIPLAWSIALLGHGIWALQTANQATATGVAMPAPAASRPRLSVLPAMLGPGAIGIRLQGRF